MTRCFMGMLWLAAAMLSLTAGPSALGDPAESVVKRASGPATVHAIPLAGHGGEEDWNALRVLPGGDALVGMTSRHHSAVLLRVAPENGDVRTVMRLDQAGHLTDRQRQPKIHVTPIRDAGGVYQFISHFGLDTHLPLHGSRLGYTGMHWWQWSPGGGGKDLGLIWPGEGAVGLAGTNQGRVLYISTFPQALLLRLDTRTGDIKNLGRTNGVYAPRHILIGPDDKPYVLDHGGRFWTLNKTGDHLRPTGIALPATDPVAGDVLAQGLVSLIPANGGGYYAAAAWGRLYRIRWENGQVQAEALTEPIAQLDELVHTNAATVRGRSPAATIAGLAQGPGGMLYLAVSGYNHAVDGSGDSFLLRCRADGTHTRLIARLDGDRIQYLCGCQAVDPEHRRVLFVGSHMTDNHPYLFVIDIPPAEGGAS